MTVAEARSAANHLIERSTALDTTVYETFSYALHAELLLACRVSSGCSLPTSDGVEYWGENGGRPWHVWLRRQEVESQP